jgi:hypothetical protein
MISENITKDDTVKISGFFGSRISNEAGLDAAILAGRNRGMFRKISYIWRALLSPYPLAEGDRKTALAFALSAFVSAGMVLDQKCKERLVSAVIRISKENIHNINRIERLLRYAVEGD